MVLPPEIEKVCPAPRRVDFDFLEVEELCIADAVLTISPIEMRGRS